MNGLSVTLKHVQVATLIVFSAFVLSGCGDSKDHNTSKPLPDKLSTGTAGDGTLKEIVEYIRVDANLPAMAVLLVHDGKIIEMTATGLRSIKHSMRVTDEDKWHIGSLTKSMTSTLAAMLVKQEVMSWDTTIGDVYPELIGKMNSYYADVRLEELVSHTSGMRANFTDVSDDGSHLLDINEQRQKVVEAALLFSPKVSRGDFLYSNLGYIFAGAMMERLTGTKWEVLLENHLFNALDMTSSGFGVPDSQGTLEQPTGHVYHGSTWQPDNSDNHPVIGPAGTVNSSLEDMGKYLAAHLAGLRGNDVSGLLTASEFSKLHTKVKNTDYASGWVVTGGVLQHSGSNLKWLASAEIDPIKNIALFMVTNAADLEKNNSIATKALHRLKKEMLNRVDRAFLR